MSKQQRRILWPAFLVLALGGTALGFISLRKPRVPKPVPAARGATTTSQLKPRLYVQRGALSPQLRSNLKAIGDRLERPGKEQVITTGSLTRQGDPGPWRVVLNAEAPRRMTLTKQSGLRTQVLEFDGTDSSWAALAVGDRDLLETLFFDTAESFFLGQMNGAATRFLGSRFRLNEERGGGPFYDIYEVTSRSELPSSRRGAKLFCFDADSLNLSLVRYEIERGSTSVKVEVRFSNWQNIGGQSVAHRIDRLENGVTVMSLIIDSVVVGPGSRGGAN